MANDTVIRVEVKDGVTGQLGTITERLRQELRVIVARNTKDLAVRVRRKLSGEVLHVRTGALLGSIQSEMHETETELTGVVFSEGITYANIHEYGGVTPAHDIYPKNASALHFFMGGEEVFAAHVHHPGSVIPERSYMRSSLGEIEDRFEGEIEAAMERATANG